MHLESTVDPFEHFCDNTEVPTKVIINCKYCRSVDNHVCMRKYVRKKKDVLLTR